MKKFKGMFSMLVAATLVMGSTTTAMANSDITVKTTVAGHTYEAYQIFKGTVSSTSLTNIEWGSGVSNAAQTALAGDDGSAATVAKSIEKAADADTFAKKLVSNNYLTSASATVSSVTENAGYVLSDLEDGYYLIKDTSSTEDVYILQLVGENVDVNPKVGAPSVVKKVKDINDTTDTATAYTDWQDSADYDIGDTVPFQLEAKLADNVSAYNMYRLVFNDTLAKGLDFNASSVVVKVDGTTVDSSYYTVASVDNQDGTKSITITFKDVKATGVGATDNSVVTVEYNATLNKDAVLGSAGNDNSVYLTYSNDSGFEYTGETSGNNDDDEHTDDTSKDTVRVFTYKVVINKLNENNQALTGATFTLSKKLQDGSKKVVDVTKNDAGTVFTFTGLDDGEYVLEETTPPTDYNAISPITFTVSATHDVEEDSPALTALSGDDATGAITFTSNTTDGSLTADIVNNKGVVLPSTGGIGTRVIYYAGGALVLAASVLLVTKRRMRNSK
jgi:fimbrial isopeptide formation D2 family protein/LPXTG-motif cell wall-anchored protein